MVKKIEIENQSFLSNRNLPPLRVNLFGDSQVEQKEDPAPLQVLQEESHEEHTPFDRYSPAKQEVQSEDVAPLQVTQEESQGPQTPEFEEVIVVPVPQEHAWSLRG